jgi:hypothetical protein
MYDWFMVVGISMKVTELTMVASNMMLYTIPLKNEYNWVALNTSEVRVSAVCLALSNPVAVMSSIVARAETLMFEAEIFPAVNNPVAVRL